MLSRFFINRPIFAWVIAIGMMLVGLGAIRTLPIAQYPDVAPPTVAINATYPGASAESLESSVTQVIEQQLTGLDGLLYFSSASSANGSVIITVTFQKGTDPDTAQVQVQNRVQQANPRLPTQVQQQGVTVAKSASDFLMIVGLYDQTNRVTAPDMADYLVSHFQDSVARVPGVGQTQVFGSQYAMRIWLDPYKLAAVQLMPSDISSAVQAQNVELSAGQIGQQPYPAGQRLTATVTAQSRLQTPDQFRAIVVKTRSDGSVVRLSDVARIELGNENYGFTVHFNGHPASGMAIQLAPGADALKTADAVKARARELGQGMPDGYALAFPRDSTEFIILSIGLLVDDAIVVVENVERVMEEEGLDPREATTKSMDEIGSALVGIALVLAAVLLPMAFFGGSTGVIYRQFSVTIVTSMLLSVVVALVLTPALTATLLKPASGRKDEGDGYGARFNRWFNHTADRYIRGVEGVAARRWLFLAIFGGIIALLLLLFVRLPTSFLPNEDQGQMIVQYTLPPGATAERTEAVEQRIGQYFTKTEKDISGFFTVNGFSFSGSGQNAGLAFTILKPFDERKGGDHAAQAVSMRATKAFAAVRDAQIFALSPPPIAGLGQSNGFTFELLNSTAMPRAKFVALRDKIIAAAGQDRTLAGVRPATLEDTPQLHVTMDQEKLAVLGLSQADADATLTAAWGSSYINDFVDRGRVKRVYMQGDAPYRALPSDLDNWFVRSATNGNMVPFSAFATTDWTKGPVSVSRFNGVSSYEIQGQAAPGASSGAAMARMVELQQQLAPGTTVAWSGLSYEEQISSGQGPILYAISIMVVFLALAALYESWSVPFAILLVLPLGMIGAVLAVSLRGLENNIYFQVGLLTTMGLAAKNAILIVEFAELAHRGGKGALQSALEAARLRLRPIMMTSIAFMAGVFPLVIATGAGAQSRIAIGTAVFGGMLTATALAIFYVPLFFVLVAKLFHRDQAAPEGDTPRAGPVAA